MRKLDPEMISVFSMARLYRKIGKNQLGYMLDKSGEFYRLGNTGEYEKYLKNLLKNLGDQTDKTYLHTVREMMLNKTDKIKHLDLVATEVRSGNLNAILKNSIENYNNVFVYSGTMGGYSFNLN